MPAKPAAKIEMLALHVASGGSVKGWCKKTGTALRTAYGWTADAAFKARVQAIQAELIAQALGKLSRHAARAVGALAGVINDKDAEDSDRIRAAAVILKQLIGVRGHIELAERVAEIEKQLPTPGASGKGTTR